MPGSALGGWWSHGRALSCPETNTLTNSYGPAAPTVNIYCSSTVPAWRIWECSVHMHPLSNSQQQHPPNGSCTASLLSCPWNPGTDNMQLGQHKGWSCRDVHTAVVLYLCLSVHTERAKRGEKKPEINIKGKSEAMNSTYVTISKDRETCWLFPLVNVPPLDLFKKLYFDG